MEELTKKLITRKRPSLINYSLFPAIAWPKSSNLEIFMCRIGPNLDRLILSRAMPPTVFAGL
jgi:hypothetical protein